VEGLRSSLRHTIDRLPRDNFLVKPARQWVDRFAEDQTWAGLDRPRRLALFRSLDERGVFAVRRAIEQTAARLGISRASAYTYLSQARATPATGADGADDTP